LWEEQRRSPGRTIQARMPSSWRGSRMTELAWITLIGSAGEVDSSALRVGASTADTWPTDTAHALAAPGGVPPHPHPTHGVVHCRVAPHEPDHLGRVQAVNATTA